MVRKASRLHPFSAEVLRVFQLSGFLAQICAGFNFYNISIAQDVYERETSYSAPNWVIDVQYTAIYSGSIAGMLLMGYYGDAIGRNWAMMVTLLVVTVGAVGSGALSWGTHTEIYMIISICRFVLGFGIGGTYPIASSLAADLTADQSVVMRRFAMAWSYAGQGPGSPGPYIWVWLTIILGASYNFEWRSVLVFGAAPAVCVLAVEGLTPKAEADVFQKRRLENDGKAKLEDVVMTRLFSSRYALKVLGSGGSWFLFDFASNSVKTLAPQIVEDFIPATTLSSVCWINIVLNTVGIMGLLATLAGIPYYNPKTMILISSIFQAATFLSIGVVHALKISGPLILVLLCVLYFFQFFGGGMCNYLVAAEMYPIEVRSTFSGLSAAIGKLGAITGIIVLNHVILSSGISAAFFTLAASSACFFMITLLFVDDESELTNDAADKKMTDAADEPLLSDAT